MRKIINIIEGFDGISHANKLDEIINALKANPLAPCIKIFGSATGDKVAPGDIDAFCEGPSANQQASLSALMRAPAFSDVESAVTTPA